MKETTKLSILFILAMLSMVILISLPGSKKPEPEPIIIREIETVTVTETVTETVIEEVEKEILVIRSEQNRIEFTNEELLEFEQLVMCEAGSSAHTQWLRILVASVVVNRVLDERYPNNLHDVIFQTDLINGVTRYQFSPVFYGTLSDAEPSKDVKKAVQLALQYDYSDGCWIFNNGSLTSEDKQEWFGNYKIVYEIDGVQFRK